MRPKAVTFDCAGTLVEVNWNPCRLAVQAAEAIGIQVPPPAGDSFGELYTKNRPEFEAANLISDDAVRDFWLEMDRAWLTSIGADPGLAEALYAAAYELLFGVDSDAFRAFADAGPMLDRLDALGLRLAVISNWDRSLGAVIRILGWEDRFEVVAGSLEFGVEKPDSRIFRHVLSRMKLEPGDVFHVGDDAIDDLQGASAVGMRAALIDRDLYEPIPPYLSSLTQVEEALDWNS